MSKYHVFRQVIFRSRDLLVSALLDLGYTAEQIETGENLQLYDWRGQPRPETADVVVRRRHIDRASNDLGFMKTPEGYVPVISEYDRDDVLPRRHGGDFVVALRKAYNRGVIMATKNRLKGSVRPAIKVGNVTRTVLRF